MFEKVDPKLTKLRSMETFFVCYQNASKVAKMLKN